MNDYIGNSNSVLATTHQGDVKTTKALNDFLVSRGLREESDTSNKRVVNKNYIAGDYLNMNQLSEEVEDMFPSLETQLSGGYHEDEDISDFDSSGSSLWISPLDY